MKNILKQRRDWDALIRFAQDYSLSRPNDIQGKTDLAEVYIWANLPKKSNEIFRQLLIKKPINPNIPNKIPTIMNSCE